MDYSNLPGLGGKDNQGGITQVVYFAPLDYFTTIKGFKAAPTIQGSLEIDGPHVFKTGKGFHTLYTTLDSGKLMMELTGERDGRGYNPKVECFHPGDKKETAAFARQCKNDQFICLIPSPNGEVFQIGTNNIFAEISAKKDTGTLSSGRNGWTFEITSYANGQIYYESPIEVYVPPVVP